MTIREEIAGALEEMENDLVNESGETQKLILPSNKELPCVPSSEDVGAEIAIGNQVEVITAVVRVRKVHFKTTDSTLITIDSDVILTDDDTPRLRSGKKPQFRGKTYRVLKVSEDPSSAYFKIFMGSAR